MKKIILTVAAVFALSFANAQDKKEGSFGFSEGDFYLGGKVQYNSTKNDNGVASVTETSTTLSPEAGYFLSDKFAVTAGLDIKNTDNGVGTKTKEFGLKLGGRYYFLNLGERFKTFTNFGLGFGSNDNGGNGAEKTNNFNIGGGLGINYFVTSSLAIDFGLSDVLNYSTSKTGDAKANSLDLNANVFNNFFDTATFGLIYKF
jgi:outer membrane protein